MPDLAILQYLSLRLAHNLLVHHFPAAPESIDDRSTLKYFADIYVSQSLVSQLFAKEITLEADEQPAKQVGTLTIRPGADIYYNDILENILRLYSQAPNPDQEVITVCEGAVLPYYIVSRITESVETPVGTTLTTPVQYALKGGLNFEDFADNQTAFFLTYLKETAKFLTWQPNYAPNGEIGKLIDEFSPEFLYLLVNFTPLPTILNLCIKVTYTDGATEDITPQSFSSPKQYHLYCFPVGFSALDLGSLSKPVKKYEVYVTNEDDLRVSEIRTYRMDTRAYREVTYWLFLNSLGGFDTFRCTGEQSQNLATTKELAKVSIQKDYTRSFAESFSSYLSSDKDITANTGWIGSDTLDYLQELFLSKEIYQVTKRGLTAVELSTKEYEPHNSQKNLLAVILKFRPSHSDRNYSKMPKTLPPILRPTAWRFKPGTEFCVQTDDDPTSSPIWQDTGNIRCKEAAPRTTSMVEKEQRDANPTTDLGLQWVDDVLNTALCPLPVILNASVTIKALNLATGWTVVSSVLGALTTNFHAYLVPVGGTITANVPAPWKIAVTKNNIQTVAYRSGPLTIDISEAANYVIFIGAQYGG